MRIALWHTWTKWKSKCTLTSFLVLTLSWFFICDTHLSRSPWEHNRWNGGAGPQDQFRETLEALGTLLSNGRFDQRLPLHDYPECQLLWTTSDHTAGSWVKECGSYGLSIMIIIILSNSTHSPYIFSANASLPFVFDDSMVGAGYKYFVLPVSLLLALKFSMTSRDRHVAVSVQRRNLT